MSKQPKKAVADADYCIHEGLDRALDPLELGLQTIMISPVSPERLLPFEESEEETVLHGKKLNSNVGHLCLN
ncbi:hypothetical protein STEG23_037729 [Scotinomys teguina]